MRLHRLMYPLMLSIRSEVRKKAAGAVEPSTNASVTLNLDKGSMNRKLFTEERATEKED